MKKTSEHPNSPWSQISLLIGFIGMAVSSIFLKGGTDPFNLPKMAVLTVGGTAVLFLLINEYLSSKRFFPKSINILVVVIILAHLNTFFLSGAPLVQQFYGVYGRNSGLLTYLSCLILFLASIKLHTEQQFRQITKFFLIAGVINLIVCILELLKLNPQGVGGSYSYGLIGTFGNPNFISSFLAIFSILLLAIMLSTRTKLYLRSISLILFCVALFFVLKTQSKQGLIVIAFGFAAVTLLFVYYKFRSRIFSTIQFLSYTSIGILGLLGTLQKGPLESLLYKPSVSYRGEYWAAGLNMFKSHFLHGVGLNSYGDWYRVSRRSSALIAPGEGITTNVSHNVFIDYAATGGVILLLSYLALIGLAGISAFRLLRRVQEFNYIFVGVLVCWLGYLLQSLISIDQIGLAVWGWILPGIIIAMDKSGFLQNPQTNHSVEKSRRINEKRISESESMRVANRAPLFLFAGVLVGTLLTLPPVNADISWRQAQKSTSAEVLVKSGKLWPRNEFKLSRVIYSLYESKLNNQALELIKIGNNEFPRSSGLWQFLYYSPNSTQKEKNLAIRKVLEVDPENKNFKKIRSQED